MKNKLLTHNTLIILAMIVALVLLIGTWRYYGDKNQKIEEEMLRINKSAQLQKNSTFSFTLSTYDIRTNLPCFYLDQKATAPAIVCKSPGNHAGKLKLITNY